MGFLTRRGGGDYFSIKLCGFIENSQNIMELERPLQC
jgi:hypothetical protein